MLVALINTLLELSPWLLLGMAIAGLLHGLLPKNFIRSQLRGRLGVIKAVALGVPLPLCSCGVIPAGLGLKKDGASDGASLGFLISTPQTGVDSILVSASFLGWPFALFKVLSATITGLVGGLLVDSLPQSNVVEAEPAGDAESEADSARSWLDMIRHSHELLESIWRWLVIGIVVSVLIETYLPKGAMSGLADMGPIAAGLAVLALSLPMYICATASVPIAAALVSNGMPVGAALVFLMAGPATNVATIGAIYRGFGARILAVYLGVIILGSIGFGAAFDLGIDAGLMSHLSPGHAHKAWWAVASALFLSLLILRLAIMDLMRWLAARANDDAAIQLEVDVLGMTCGTCVSKVEGALLGVDGVVSAVVTRNPDRAIIRGTVDRDRIDRANI
jgi:uncharacterized membrane protein YraQ (UPF0718 family)/copper chaperone CopZ